MRVGGDWHLRANKILIDLALKEPKVIYCWQTITGEFVLHYNCSQKEILQVKLETDLHF